MKMLVNAVLCGVIAAGVQSLPQSFFSRPAAKAVRVVGDDPAPSPAPAPDPQPEPKPVPQPEPPNPKPAPVPDPVPPPEPQLILPDKVQAEVGDYLRIDANTNGRQVHWKSMTPGLKVFPNDTLADPHLTVVSSFTPGTYTLWAYTSLNDILADTEMLVTIIGPQPPPNPQPPVPPPDPVPNPPPATSQIPLSTLYVVTIDDVLARTPAVATVLTDNKLWSVLKAQGVQFEKLNKTNPAIARFAEQIKRNVSQAYPTGMPCIVLMDSVKLHANQPGSWLNQGPGELQLPSTSDALVELIGKYAK